MYWPSKQAKTEVHGPLRVTYLDEEAFAHYTVRRFEVKPVEQGSHYSQVRAVAKGHRFCLDIVLLISFLLIGQT